MSHRPSSLIGDPGKPWGHSETGRWRSRVAQQRSYADDVGSAVNRLRERFDVVEYGQVDCSPEVYPLLAIKSADWRSDLPTALVTGGVHGYETSGVLGALHFAEHGCDDYFGRVNVLVVPCVSPWAYEHVQRWNAFAVDPNRSFQSGSAPEAAAVRNLVSSLARDVLVHIDLHETTDSDETEFRPALAARDGKPFAPSAVPDGFYLVADQSNPALTFQQAIIGAVSQVTHIAPADAAGEIIGVPIASPGVIYYRTTELGLCAGITAAPYTTTTEVYPNSPLATPERCVLAQVTAVRAALDFSLANQPASRRSKTGEKLASD